LHPHDLKEFTDQLYGLRKLAQRGKHEFYKLCAVLDIDHRLTPPMSPQTNGLVERLTAGLRTSSKATTSNLGKNWKPRCTAMSGFTTVSSHNQP
jgi:hypothetical protein